MRDQFLDKKQYKSIMETPYGSKILISIMQRGKLWITENELRDIESMGHTQDFIHFHISTQISKLNKKNNKIYNIR